MGYEQDRMPVGVLPSYVDGQGALELSAYQRAVAATDRLPPGELSTATLGLFGEVGSLLSALKKQRRDAGRMPNYNATVLEELGDTLWYFTCLACRANLKLTVIAQRAFRGIDDWDEVDPKDEFGTWSDIQGETQVVVEADFSKCLMHLATLAGELVSDLRADRLEGNRDRLSASLVSILRVLISVAERADIDLSEAARQNLRKTFSRWPEEAQYPPLVDADMPKNEQLPRQFEMLIEEHQTGGKTYVTQTCNGIIIGDRLTDNKAEKDDYRFHDVFHIAYAVHLGWSPVIRSLFRVKRKSRPDLDENEDGARALIIEEGVSTFVFGAAQERGPLFEGLEQVDFDLLKMIQEFVRGYEPERRCALWQWERAILDGFKVFRQLKTHRRGYVVADLEAHTLSFRLTDE